MSVKYLAALAVSGILTVVLPISADIQDAKSVELAGADEETLDLEEDTGQVRVDPIPDDGNAIGKDGLKTVGAVGVG